MLARKPLIGTNVENVLAWGTGALNIDGCRVGTEGGTKGGTAGPSNGILGDGLNGSFPGVPVPGLGRFPANILHDGSDEVLAAFPHTKSGSLNAGHKQGEGSFGKIGGDLIARNYGGDSGSAARFFKECKNDEVDPRGLDNFDCACLLDRDGVGDVPLSRFHYCAKASAKDRAGSKHPTVKPISLMRWLCRLITPPGGTVLDPFAGSGTTGVAALEEGFNVILCERETEYLEDITRRLKDA